MAAHRMEKQVLSGYFPPMLYKKIRKYTDELSSEVQQIMN